MGMLDSFKNQVARDAGKVTSNFLFGDKHAAPYRRVNAEAKETARKTATENRAEIEDRRLQILKDAKEKEDLYALDRAVISAVDQVVAKRIPTDEKDIINLAKELEVQLELSHWEDLGKDKERAKIRNKYPDAVLQKYEQCVEELKFAGANSDRLESLTNKILVYNKKKQKEKNKTSRKNLIIALIAIPIIIFFLLVITKPF